MSGISVGVMIVLGFGMVCSNPMHVYIIVVSLWNWCVSGAVQDWFIVDAGVIQRLGNLFCCYVIVSVFGQECVSVVYCVAHVYVMSVALAIDWFHGLPMCVILLC